MRYSSLVSNNLSKRRNDRPRSEEHTSELQSLRHLVCRLLLEKKKHTSELQSLRHLVCRLLLGKKYKSCSGDVIVGAVCLVRVRCIALDGEHLETLSLRRGDS